MGVEVSSNNHNTLENVLFSIVNLCVYPVGVLINKQTKELTINFSKALTNIFRIIDYNNNLHINEKSLLNLELEVCGYNLGISVFGEAIKEFKEKNPLINISENITEKKFKKLFQILLNQMKITFCWVMLIACTFSF